MSETPLWSRTASELARLVDQGDASSRDVIDSHLDRIAAVNPRLNAITVEMADDARAAADAADRTDPASRGPLHGVPFTIKENIDQAGFATTQGVAAFADARPSIDGPTVARLRAAGGIPIGRTNMPELGLRVSTDNAFRGLTRNPWHRERTAGGSSGGEGSAIAAGMSPLGLGNDIGGSIRNPALCNGIVGLKPGFGRIPRHTSVAAAAPGISSQLMSVEGPLARSIADLRLALEVLGGPYSPDPRSLPLTAGNQGNPGTERRRVAMVRTVAGTTLHAGADAALDAAETALRDAGWEIDVIEAPELVRIKEVWAHMLAFDIRPTLPLLEPIMGELELNVLYELINTCDESPMAPESIFTERYRLGQIWNEIFERWPTVIGPGWTRPPFIHGADVAPDEQMDVLDDHLGFIVPANALGLPSVALTTTVHDLADGTVPMGVQVMGRIGDEHGCLDVAEIIEAGVLGARNGPFAPLDPAWD